MYIFHPNKARVHPCPVTQVVCGDEALHHSPCCGRFFRSSEAVRIFWMSSWLLNYCFIHRAWTNYFNSSLQWGADWQLPSLEWSVCFVYWAEAIWCILTIIGATATMMFSKPLCYFPGGCPWGIFRVAARSTETPSEWRQMGGLLFCADQQTPRPNHHYHLKRTYSFSCCSFWSSEKQDTTRTIRAASRNNVSFVIFTNLRQLRHVKWVWINTLCNFDKQEKKNPYKWVWLPCWLKNWNCEILK